MKHALLAKKRKINHLSFFFERTKKINHLENKTVLLNCQDFHFMDTRCGVMVFHYTKGRVVYLNYHPTLVENKVSRVKTRHKFNFAMAIDDLSVMVKTSIADLS